MKIARRMGPPGSAIWNSMLDATEVILCEEGYGALTSRLVAERAGVKQRLVYYYFRTMDDLIVETFRRGAGRELERLDEALSSKNPLQEIWDIYFRTYDVRLIAEFMALANHIEALRVEVKNHIEKTRKIQVLALTKSMDAAGYGESLSPVAVAIFAMSAALSLQREARLGIQSGHAKVISIINEFIAAGRPGNQCTRQVPSKPEAPSSTARNRLRKSGKKLLDPSA